MKNGYTPKEYAHDLAISNLKWLFDNQFSWGEDITDHDRHLVRRQLAKLHNRLLRDSGLDGMELEVPHKSPDIERQIKNDMADVEFYENAVINRIVAKEVDKRLTKKAKKAVNQKETVNENSK